jgi:predicted TPR repeat methyltransferase
VELTAYLTDWPGTFDVIVSADTLCYFGALEDVAAAAARALHAGGLLVFTVEELVDAAVEAGYLISPHGRYAHKRPYVEHVLAGVGLQPEIVEAELRLEAGSPVRGLVVRARKPMARTAS